MTIAERIRKHRAKLRAEQCSRLDVYIAGWMVKGIRQLAKAKGHEPWAEVQDVLEQHLIANGVQPGAPPADVENQRTSATN
jgi:hypothetical protein